MRTNSSNLYRKTKNWLSKWEKIDYQAYLQDFSIQPLYWVFALISVLVLFQISVKKFLNILLINPLFSICPQKWTADIVFLIFFISSIIFFSKQILRHLLPTINSIIFAAGLIFVYYIFFKSDSHYIFYQLTFLNISYSSLFLGSIIIFISTYKCFLNPLKKTRSNQYFLLDDSTLIDSYKDYYGRSGFAVELAKHILATTSDVSFAISIIGEWGSGKTDFLNRLKKELRESNENIVSEFRPWRVNNPDAIIDEFFKTLSSSLSPYNRSVGQTIKEYSSRLLKTSKEIGYRFMDEMINRWFPEKDIEEQYDTINKIIGSTSKRLIIFIDDIDRLSGKEILEVLRIIRNTANFRNTFFIVGIEESYLVEALKNIKSIANEQEYLKKIFQLSITLPAFKRNIFSDAIRELLFTSEMNVTDKREIIKALSMMGLYLVDEEVYEEPPFSLFMGDYYFSFADIIDNLRDLKRFCNSFKIVFNIIKDEADIYDLIILELIRNKDVRVYNSIRNQDIFKNTSQITTKFEIDDSKLKNILERLELVEPTIFQTAITCLFSDSTYKNNRKIVERNNFYIYFSYQLFNLISMYDFKEAIEMDVNGCTERFQRWNNEEKGNDLYHVLFNIENFGTIDQFRKIITAILEIPAEKMRWIELAKRLVVVRWKENHQKYFGGDNDGHKRFLKSIWEDKAIDPFARASLFYPFLGANQGFFIDDEELKKTILSLFDNYLILKPEDMSKTLQFYYLNYDKAIDRKTKINVKASEKFREYLLSEDHSFENFIKKLFRPSQVPYDGWIVFEPFLDQIFPDISKFKDKLESTGFGDSNVMRLKGIILEYIDKYFASDKQPVRIEDESDRQFVEQFVDLKSPLPLKR